MSRHKYPEFDGTQNCYGKDTEHFYLDDRAKDFSKKKRKLLMDAQILCSTCPFLEPCRTYALHNEEYGIWGGTTPMERKILRKKFGIKLISRKQNSDLRKSFFKNN